MGSKVKRIEVEAVPGAKENRVRSMISCGVRTHAKAMTVAAAFITDLEKMTAKHRECSSTDPDK